MRRGETSSEAKWEQPDNMALCPESVTLLFMHHLCTLCTNGVFITAMLPNMYDIKIPQCISQEKSPSPRPSEKSLKTTLRAIVATKMHVHAHMHRTHILARIHLVRRDIFRHLRRGLVGAAPLPRPVAAGDKTISDWTFGLRLHSDWISVLPLISCVGEGYSLIRRFSPCLCTCHGSIVVCRPSSC